MLEFPSPLMYITLESTIFAIQWSAIEPSVGKNTCINSIMCFIIVTIPLTGIHSKLLQKYNCIAPVTPSIKLYNSLFKDIANENSIYVAALATK